MSGETSGTVAPLTSVTGAIDEPDLGGPVTAARPVHPYVHVVIISLIGAVIVLAWLVVFEQVSKLLWENEFVTTNRWMFPVICLPFSLLVGLLVKYRHAPTNLDGSMLDTLSASSRIDWRGLPINALMAWVSLFSGAVLGPEGGIGGIASKVAALYGEKVGIPLENRSQLVFATLASAYNGLVANPLFTGVLGTELIKDPEAKSRNMPANLIGGSIGYLVFFAVGSTGLQDYLHLPPARAYAPVDILLVVVFGLIGLLLAVFSGVMFRVASAFFGRFEGREVERALVAGLIFSVVGVVAPIVLFSGESQVKTVSADPAAYGPAVLVAMALVKLALLAVAFKSGFLGGPTFPAIFASVCVALAIGLLLPGIPADVIIGGVMAGLLMVLFKAPLMVILLTSVMLQAGAGLISLIVLAVAAVMVVLPYVTALLASRLARRAADAVPGGSST
jgi:H+/Cl- antiporter ClcA